MSLALSNGNNIIAAIGESGFETALGRVRIIDNFQSQNPVPKQNFPKGDKAGDEFGKNVELSNDGNRIAVGSLSTKGKVEVKIFDYDETPNTPKWDKVDVAFIPDSEYEYIVDFSLSGAGDKLAVATNETAVVLYDITENNTLFVDRGFERVSLSDSGRVLAAGNKNADCNGGDACEVGVAYIYDFDNEVPRDTEQPNWGVDIDIGFGFGQVGIAECHRLRVDGNS